jgi:hypothetical protein
MRCMSTPTVIEALFAFEPVTSDPFVADLDDRSPETQDRLAAFLTRAADAPQRRVYD